MLRSKTSVLPHVVKLERVREKRKFRGKELVEANPPALSLFY
jgi:hypothetical protein